MKILFRLFFLLIVSCNAPHHINETPVPSKFLGHFTDDYSIHYRISTELFLQEPGIKYHILKWNIKEQYIIAKNDPANPSDKNLYTKIDYTEFENMEPFLWGFCFTAYKASSDKEAENAAAADRRNPKKGCDGFPFSRMKRIE